MEREDILDIIRENLHLTDRQIGQLFNPTKSKRAIIGLRTRYGIQRQDPDKPIEQLIEEDGQLHRLQKKSRVTDKKYKQLLDEKELLEEKIEATKLLSAQCSTHRISRQERRGHHESTIVALASDWHIEENVTQAQTSGLSEYNLDISRKRADHFFKILLRLCEIENQHTDVKHLVLGLLGDFISGDIHDDTSKSALLEPVYAIVRCREYLKSGIQFLLDNSELRLTIVCHSGNHGRKDKGQLVANEAGNSLEYLMYQFLASDFEGEDRIKFMIPEGYHSYVDIYGTVVRFHHGHAIRYGGGVGGITIPVRKAIAQWNQGRKADLDCFGHFHQAFDGNNFVCNGSMIGYSAYGLFVKGEFQRPMQMTFGIHSEHGKYVTRPVLFPR